jgi:hypothetical protein
VTTEINQGVCLTCGATSGGVGTDGKATCCADTTERIEAIRKRAEAATPGPWVTERDTEVVTVYAPAPFVPEHPVAPMAVLYWPGHTFEETRQAEVLWYDTADFIAHAREDVPYLLAALDAAKAESATLRVQIEAERTMGADTIETLRMQLVGCSTASFQNTEASKADRIAQDNPYWSVAYSDVCAAVDREIALRAERDALRAKLDQAMLDRSDANAARDLEHVSVVALQMERDALKAEVAELRQRVEAAEGVIDTEIALHTQARAEAERWHRVADRRLNDASELADASERAEAVLREARENMPGYINAAAIIDAYFTTQQTKDTDQ